MQKVIPLEEEAREHNFIPVRDLLISCQAIEKEKLSTVLMAI